MESKIPEIIVDKIIDDICTRGGLKQVWHEIDEDTKREIKEHWTAIIIGEICP